MGDFLIKKQHFYFQDFHLEMTENALCPKAPGIMSSPHCFHFGVSLSAATRISPEKNTEKREIPQNCNHPKSSLLMKVAHMNEARRYPEARTEAENTRTYSKHLSVRNTN